MNKLSEDIPSTTGTADVPSATGPADIPSAATGTADVSSATTGTADVSSATTGPADVSSATTGPADIPSAAGTADVSSATGPADIPSATTGTADIPSTAGPADISSTAGTADVSSATTGPADIPSAAGTADVSSATTGTADIPSTAGTADVSSATTGPADVSSANSPSPTRHKGWYTHGYLPHFDADEIFQFITFRLHDSIPAALIEKWEQELNWHKSLAADSKEAIELRKRIEKYLDSGKGACYLRDERIARLVQDALKCFDGERYRLIAWCIMPNHVHVLIQMMDEPLIRVVKSWKSYTAHEANKILGRSGPFWMPDYFDRYIRNEEHFQATVTYILQNPVKAGLVDAPEKWPWSGYIH